MNPFLGSITIFTGNYAPLGWALCNGQLMSITQNTALFSLLGTMYGGDGRTTFALPDLQSRVPMHVGNGFVQGQVSGTEVVTLVNSEIPPHAHQVRVGSAAATTNSPTAALFAGSSPGSPQYALPGAVVQASPGTIAPSSGNNPHNNLMPYLSLNFIIALQGIFPSRG